MTFNSPSPSSSTSSHAGRDWTAGPAKFILIACLGAIAGTGLTWSILRNGSPLHASTPNLAPNSTSSTAHGATAAALNRDVLSHSDDLPSPRHYEESPSPSSNPAAPSTASITKPTSTKPAAPGVTQTVDSSLLNLNTATQAQIELLPGIGPALASRIIEHRSKNGSFKSIADLDAVSGIGPKMIEKLKPLVRFE